MTAAADFARRAEVIDMMMRADEDLEILEACAHLMESIFHHDVALRQVHSGIDHRPFAASAID